MYKLEPHVYSNRFSRQTINLLQKLSKSRPPLNTIKWLALSIILLAVAGANRLPLLAMLAACWYLDRYGYFLLCRIAEAFGLLDVPDHRKLQVRPIPLAGGIGLFALLAGCWAWLTHEGVTTLHPLFLSLSTLFVVGLADDKKGLSAKARLLVQINIALILCLNGYRLQSLHGLLGVTELSLYLQYPVSIVLIVGGINAFNLIDGMDGLLGTLLLLTSMVLTLAFAYLGNSHFMLISAVLAGAMLAFLPHNLYKARLYMGDAGSTLAGCLVTVLALYLWEEPQAQVRGLHVLAPLVLLIPFGDMARVVLLRLSRGQSPFVADRNHLHHILLVKTGSVGASLAVLVIGQVVLLAIVAQWLYW